MVRKILISLLFLLLLAGCGRRDSATPPATLDNSRQQASEIPPATSTRIPAVTQKPEATPVTMGTQEMPVNEMATGVPSAFAHDHLATGPHMKFTSRPEPTEADRQRAEAVAAQARVALEKYRDVEAAIANGYQVFAPDVPQDVYHFVNYREALSNLRGFDPTRPTALLYKKVQGGWEFFGAMYSAPMLSTEIELDARYPISVGEWHAHVNICVPENLQDLESLANDARFGFEGSIVTRQDCDTAGGHFYPDILGWMVHVNLSEND